MSSSMKIAGMICLSLVETNNAFMLSPAPARLAVAKLPALSSATQPPRFASLRMQSQPTDEVKAAAELSSIVGIKAEDTTKPVEKGIAGEKDQSSAETMEGSVQMIEELERSSGSVRVSVAETRKKVSAKSSTVPEENVFAQTALKFGALKESSPLLTSTLVGNKGFDPLNFAKDEGLLLQFREAEVKHARLAMLASVGWVASELLHPSFSSLLNKPSLLATTAAGVHEKAPSVLNGGLGAVPAWAWGVLVIVSGAIDIARMVTISEKPLSFTPGALGFDPLNFYKLAGPEEKKSFELKEINNGRLAMLAIATFAAKEYLFDSAIVNQSPELFTRGPLANAIAIPGLLLQYSGLFSCQTGLTYCAQGDTDVVKAILGTTDAGVAEQAEYINSIMSTNLFL